MRRYIIVYVSISSSKHSLHLLNYTLKASVCAENEPGYAEDDDQYVLVEDPAVLAELVGPERDDLDDGREDERQRRAAEGAHQADDAAEVRDQLRRRESGKEQHDPGDRLAVHQVLLVSEARAHHGPHDAHRHVELETVGQEDRRRHHGANAVR